MQSTTPSRSVSESDLPRAHQSSRLASVSRRYLTSSTVAVYAGMFLLVVSLLAVGYRPPEHTDAAASAVAIAPVKSNGEQTAPSADEVVATSVAANIAQTANLPVAQNVANLSQSLTAESVLTQNDTNIVAKPQIVEPTADSREVKTYTAQAGDSVQTVAERYSVSAETVRWANNLDSDALEAGRELKILPTDGVVVKAGAGQSLQAIAEKYKADPEQVKLFNDLDLENVSEGRELIIPGGVLPEAERPGYVAPRAAASSSQSSWSSSGNAAASAVNRSIAGASAGNRYAFGNCTWYAYERRAQLGKPVGSFWGNAATWASYGAAAGYAVDGNPAPGAIMQNGGGYGHVAIVESVNPGVSVTISEMNGYRWGGGFNRIGQGEIPWGQATSGMYRYIH